MIRTSWVLLALALLVVTPAPAASTGAQNEERRVTLEFTEAPLVEVLRLLFHETPYAFSLDPGLEGLRITVSLRDATFAEALRAILSSHGLEYTTRGSCYEVARRGADRSRARRSPLEPLMIYARELPDEERTQIVWRAFSSHPRSYRVASEEHVLYTVPGTNHLPVELGLLPCPDGSSLLIWQLQGVLGRDQTTRWRAVRLADGALTELGETPGLPWISAASPLPYWDYWGDHYRLVLIPGSCVFTPDLGTLSGSLPGPATPSSGVSAPDIVRRHEEYEERLTAYCRQHHQAEAEHLRSAFAGLAAEMEVGYLGFEDPADHSYLLLRSLGIPSVRNLGREGWATPTVNAACSPDGKLIAYADVWRHAVLPGPEGPPPAGYGWGARLDVFDVASGRRVWYARRASAPRWLPEAFRSAQRPAQGTMPRFRDLRWSPDGRCLSFTTDEAIYEASQVSSSVTVLEVASGRPMLVISGASNAFVITPPAAPGASEEK